VRLISDRLEQAGLIRNAQTFRTYLLWAGLDTVIQTGTYRLSPAQTGRDIAQALKSKTLTEVTFSILPGWRLEEIAASLPTSGLDITPPPFWRLPRFPPMPPTSCRPVPLPKASCLRQIYSGAYHLSRTIGFPAAAKLFFQDDSRAAEWPYQPRADGLPGGLTGFDHPAGGCSRGRNAIDCLGFLQPAGY